MKNNWIIAIAGLSVLTITKPAIASSYISSNGAINLVLNERSKPYEGFYFTEVQGRQEWSGNIKITKVEGILGSRNYTGTFRNSTIGSSHEKTCIGNINIIQRSIGQSDRLGAEVTWKVTGGTDCPSIGKTMKLMFEETLPRSSETGEFANIGTYMSETSGEADWPTWRVVSPDGTLNCRVTPNGKIQRRYNSGTEIEVGGRGFANLKVTPSGSWLFTRQMCYVRANSRYIKPVSLPD